MFTRALTTFLALGAILLLLVAALGFVVVTGARRSGRLAGWRDAVVASIGPIALPAAWLVAATATAGSLYYSEVAGYLPCEFCWYQRIAMYPLALVLAIAAWKKDRAIGRYAIPLAGAGAALATYHYLMQHFPNLATGSCSATAPCTAAWVWEFGFVSIPLMALACFLTITWLLAVARAHRA